MPARFFRAAALREGPMPMAWTRSTRSVATTLEMARELRMMASGLADLVTTRTHSPPKPWSSPLSGPSSAATMTRAPDRSSATAASTTPRAAGDSASAGRMCKMVAPGRPRTTFECSSSANAMSVCPIRCGPPQPASCPLHSAARCGETQARRLTQYEATRSVPVSPPTRGRFTSRALALARRDR